MNHLYFDTHAHYDDSQFDADRDELLRSMPEHGVTKILNAACDLTSSIASLELARKYPFVFASAGVHPHEASGADDAVFSEIEKLTQDPRVCAIGEIGLDYYYDLSPRDVQKTCFRAQMDLARSTGMPVIVHEREAAEDCLTILREYPDVHGVCHCYSGSWETAKTLLSLGWYLSFTGAVTFKNARRAPEVIRNMPIDRLMIETDSPYLTPVPNRGKRNSSLNLPFIAEAIAGFRDISPEEVAHITMENGQRFFRIEHL